MRCGGLCGQLGRELRLMRRGVLRARPGRDLGSQGGVYHGVAGLRGVLLWGAALRGGLGVGAQAAAGRDG